MTNTDKPSWKNFKVAVLTAGDMRSFAFTARSWERYLLEPWAENVHLFAFVSAQPHCPLDDKGIDKLRDLATSYETIHKVKKGNVFDMYERRYRAYRLAIQYSEEKAFQWDLFLFTRTDIAYYSPIVPLYTYYTHLLHNNIENKRRGIITPYMCRFNGICDRHAVGLSEEMAVYFERDWLMRLVHLYDSNTTMGAQLRASLRCPHISEQLPALWLQIHNITALETVPRTIAFFTLRSSKGWEYCHSNRDHVLSSTNFSWVDRTTLAVFVVLGQTSAAHQSVIVSSNETHHRSLLMDIFNSLPQLVAELVSFLKVN
eukprot:gene9826-10870_t